MRPSLPLDLVDRVVARHPLPVADAVEALAAAEGPHEARDRVVEVFRACIRLLSAVALSARLQYGPGPSGESQQVPGLLKSLQRRGLTDGQWVGLARELTRSWASERERYALPGLVACFHGDKRFKKTLDALLKMRKAETVAHGATGDVSELHGLLAQRLPQLAQLLEALEGLWAEHTLVVPLSGVNEEGPQGAWRLMGTTPIRGRWRRLALEAGIRLPPGQPVLLGAAGEPKVALHPVLSFRRPSPEATEELFFLEGGHRRGARYVSLPAMSEHREAEALDFLADALAEDEAAEDAGPTGRPYRGLAAFGPEHASLFFGREAQAEALANRIRAYPLVTVTGPSGAGKSSLLAAGVLPQLQETRTVWMRPGSRPWQALKARLSEAMEVEFGDGVEALARGVLEACRQDGVELVLVVDQAEELLTLCADAAERETFAEAIAALTSDPDGPVTGVLSVREDFFARLGTLWALGGRYTRHVEVVNAPDAEALARTLVGPASVFGVQFEDPSLVEMMVKAVHGQPAALALLQFCADQLWESRDRIWKRLTWDAYRALGGVEGALASHADAVFDGLTPAQQERARNVLLQLVTGERTRAVVPRNELAGEHDEEAVLDRLIEARMLAVREGEDGTPQVELVHEALLVHWDRLAGWLAEDREGQRLRQAVTQASREWESRGRPPGLLWRDEALEELSVWRRRASLTQLQRAFAEASEAQDERERTRRRRLVSGTLAGMGAVVVVVSGLGWVAWARSVEATEQAARAEAEAARAVEQAEAARQSRIIALIEESQDPTRAAGWLMSGLDRTHPRWAGLSAKTASSKLAYAVGEGHDDRIFSVAYSPDGRRVVTASRDSTARIWAVDGSAEPVVLRGHEGFVWSAAFGPEGRRVVTTSTDGTARVWDVHGNEEPVVLHGHGGWVWGAAFSPDGKLVVTGSDDGTARIWQADGSGDPVVLSGHSGEVRTVSFSPDGARVLTASRDGTARVWRVDESKGPVIVMGREEPSNALNAASYSLDGEWVLMGSEDGTGRVWRADGTGGPVVLEGHAGGVTVARFSQDGDRVLTGGRDGTVRVWRANGRGEAVILDGHTDEVSDAAFSPDGSRIVTVSYDGTLLSWPADGSGAPRSLSDAIGAGWGASVVYSMDGGELAVAGPDGTVRVFRAGDPREPVTLDWRERPVEKATFSSDGSRVVTASRNGLVLVWRADGTGEPVVLKGHAGSVSSASFSPDGERVVTASVDGTTRVWLADGSGDPVVLERHAEPVNTASFSRDGSMIVTGSQDGTARVWRIPGSSEPLVLDGHDDAVNSATFDPEGLRVLTASSDGTARVWTLDASRDPVILAGHADVVQVAAFSPDGSRVITASQDGSARIWRADGGGKPIVLEGHEGPLTDASFDSDGTHVVTTSFDGGVRVWPAGERGEAMEFVTGEGATAASFGPRDERVVAAVSVGGVTVWHLDGSQEPMTLKGRDGWMSGASFSPQGDRVLTSHGTIWRVGAEALYDYLRSATTYCPSVADRMELLADPRGRAEREYAACRAEVARVHGWQGRAKAPVPFP